MNQSQIRSPWEYSKALLSLAPAASNASQNHAAIDRTGYRSMIVDLAVSASGAPTGGTVTAKIQDSADGQTWADYAPGGVAASVQAALTVANAAAGFLLSLPVHLGAARQFVRAVSVGAPTGGTSPIVSVAATARLHGPDNLPAL